MSQLAECYDAFAFSYRLLPALVASCYQSCSSGASHIWWLALVGILLQRWLQRKRSGVEELDSLSLPSHASCDEVAPRLEALELRAALLHITGGSQLLSNCYATMSVSPAQQGYQLLSL